MFAASDSFISNLAHWNKVNVKAGRVGIYEIYQDELGRTHKTFRKYSELGKVYCAL